MKILSLFWHNILPDSVSSQNLAQQNPMASMFRDHVRFIIDRYTPISISDFVRIADNPASIQSYAKPPILLGFDDGFRNIITEALPILNEFRTPAVFFVIGEILKNPEFVPWFVEFTHLIRKTAKRKLQYDGLSIDLSSRQDFAKLGCAFEASLRACASEAHRQRLLTDLADLLGVERPKALELDEDLRFVTKDDLATLTDLSLLTVSSHAMTHRHLDGLTYDEQVYELEQSDLLLREHCPSYYPAVSYPGGSFNPNTVHIAKGIYKAGFTVLLGSSYRNLYAYPRIGINHATTEQLAYITSPKRLNYLLPLKRFLLTTGIRRSM